MALLATVDIPRFTRAAVNKKGLGFDALQDRF